MDILLGRQRANEVMAFDRKYGLKRPRFRPMPKLTYYAAPPFDPCRNAKANGTNNRNYRMNPAFDDMRE